MDLMPGELVETKGGRIGRVIYAFRMTAFVGFPRVGADEFVSGYLASDLHRIDENDRCIIPCHLPTPLAELCERIPDHYHSAALAVD